MRDGRGDAWRENNHSCEFLSSLWGMEVVFHLELSHIHCLLVFIVPMRDGSFFLTLRNSPFFFQFLSSLWGMEVSGLDQLKDLIIQSFYRPYEGWKWYFFFWIYGIIEMFLSSLWGMEGCVLDRDWKPHIYCFYRPYEGWKDFFYFFLIFCQLSVFIVPMRDGRFPESPVGEKPKSKVFIVPMRDGRLL